MLSAYVVVHHRGANPAAAGDIQATLLWRPIATWQTLASTAWATGNVGWTAAITTLLTDGTPPGAITPWRLADTASSRHSAGADAIAGAPGHRQLRRRPQHGGQRLARAAGRDRALGQRPRHDGRGAHRPTHAYEPTRGCAQRRRADLADGLARRPFGSPHSTAARDTVPRPASRIEVAERWQGVSVEPFERVVAEHGATVLRVCRALLPPADAEDAWSETFLAALRAYPTLRPGSNVRGWLVTIAHRKAIDQLRAAKRAPVPAGVLPDQPAVTDTSIERLDRELGAAIADLTPKQQAAVVLHHLAGLPYAEVGALLDTSEAAARRSAADGIANLRLAFAKGTTR